jgi:glycosyltransferase involved in cell wall biosynthesis
MQQINNQTKFSLVVPVFNEEQALPHTLKRLSEVFKSNDYLSLKLKLQLILVNDGSQDLTPELLNNIDPEYFGSGSEVDVVHFSRNFGHSLAVLAGLEQASGQIVGIIDADLQDPPELLIPMIEKLQSGCDVVYGQRKERHSETFFKRFTAWAFYRVINSMAGFTIPKDTGDFRVMTQEVQQAVLKFKEQEPFLRGLVAWLGFKQQAFLYERDGRRHGVTKYPFKKMVKFAVQALLAFSNAPLRIAIYICFLTLVLAIGLSAWAFSMYFQGQTVPGWTSLLIVFLFFQSITFAVLGIFGLYLSQIHSGVQNRPRYVVKVHPK